MSDTADQARDFLRQIRNQIEDNPLIRRDYPESSGKGQLWRDQRICLRNGCEILVLGTGGKLRGRKSATNRRPTLVIADDIQNKDHIVSELRRARTFDWFVKDVMSVGEPTTNFVVLGTALHRDTVVCRLEATPGWQSRKWKALESWPERMDLWREWESYLFDYSTDDSTRVARALSFFESKRAQMEAGSRVLWPAREPLYDLMTKRASDGYAAFESEKQNSPVDPGTCEWPEEYLNFPGMWFDEWPALESLSIRTIAFDPSKGRADRLGDYSAVVLFGRDRNGAEYVEADLTRGQPVDTVCHELAKRIHAFRPHGVAVEANQFQELLLIPLEQAAKAQGLDLLPTYPYTQTDPKVVRIRGLTPFLSQRRFRFKTRSPGTMLLVQQMRDWPSGSHDDGPDALALAREHARDLHNGTLPKQSQVIARMHQQR